MAGWTPLRQKEALQGSSYDVNHPQDALVGMPYQVSNSSQMPLPQNPSNEATAVTGAVTDAVTGAVPGVVPGYWCSYWFGSVCDLRPSPKYRLLLKQRMTAAKLSPLKVHSTAPYDTEKDLRQRSRLKCFQKWLKM